ncbi:TorD/DmsD family molecular chaperone [Thiorhodococcus fuscus]|uniref:Molecular chaperone n=1 Tax=Thiorhodococcus fuscus TaxID=527200 RepID=A0ABW4Y6V5_9GAMM
MVSQNPTSAGTAQGPAHLRRLSVLLAMPEEGALDALREMSDQAPWLAEAVAELEGVALDRWQAEHTRLFVSGYPKTPCPPFESAYRQGQMGGRMASDLVALYRRVGLEPQGVPADYLGTLLECAAYLADLARSAVTDSDPCPAVALERELWSDHLGRWLPRFATDLEHAAQLKLYRVLAVRLGALMEEGAIDDDG